MALGQRGNEQFLRVGAVAGGTLAEVAGGQEDGAASVRRVRWLGFVPLSSFS